MKSLIHDEDVPDRLMVHIELEQLVPRELLGTRFDSRISIEELEHAVVASTPMLRSSLERVEPTVLLVEQLALLDGEPLYLRAGYHPAGTDPLAVAGRIRRADGATVQAVDLTFADVFGVPYGSSTSVIEAVRCEGRTAQLLGIREGDVVLLREMIVRDIDAVPRSVSYTHYRADRVALVANAASGTSL